MEIRPTEESDLRAAYEVFRAAIEELYGRHSFAPPAAAPDAFLPQQAHVLRHDRDRSLVALEDDRIVGFGSAIARGSIWYLSALFVRPEFQQLGIGRAAPRATRSSEARARDSWAS